MRILFFLFSFLATLSSFGQNPPQAPKWVIPPLAIDFSGSTPTASNIPGAPTTYIAANSAFDAAGNLLFYIVDRQILDASSNLIFSTDALTTVTQNHMIVRVPNSCTDYFVIYSNPEQVGLPLYYTRLRHTTAGTVVTVAGQTDVIFGSVNGFINTFAVSDLRTDNTRKLYHGGSDIIQVFSIDANGISFQSSLNINLTRSITPIELDLNHTANRLAISSFVTPTVILADINAAGNLLPAIQLVNFTNIQDTRGVEFSANGNQLVVSGGTFGGTNSGISVVDLTQASTPITNISNSQQFARSQIELGFDGLMYFTDGTSLASLDLSTNTINTAVLPLPSVGLNAATDVFSLPHQVDGQDYSFPTLQPDLWIADGTADVGIEPNPQLSSVWEGEIWNCNSGANCSLTNAENPGFKSIGDNFMRVTVRNRGACPSRPADLHLYWTFARTGEIWDDHWLDPQINPSNQINGCPAGGEITADANANSVPLVIPSIAPGGSLTMTHPWKPQNPNCYPLNTPGGVFNSSNDPMICYLARIDSDEDPIQGENFGMIKPNIINSNNIATRNSYLIKLSPCKKEGIGGSISLFNIEDYPQLMNIRISEVNPGNGNPPFLETGDLQLVLNTDLWNAWVSTGMQGEGVEVFSEGVIRITDLNNAVLYGVEVAPAQGQPMTLVATMPQDYTFEQRMTYSFMLSHETDMEPTGNSAGVYRFELSPDCEVQMRSEETVATGGCTTIGPFADEEFCAFSWSPETGLSNPNSARTEACPDVSTTYTLTVFSPNGCESSSSVNVVVTDPSTERFIQQSSPIADQQFWLFPNPAKDVVSAEFQLTQSDEVQIVIYNQLGQIVSTPLSLSRLAKGYHRVKLSAEGLAAGLYFCELQIGEETSTKQLVITE